MTAHFVVSLLVVSVGAGCGSGDGFGTGVPEVDCNEFPIPAFAEVQAFPHTCNACHTVQISDDDPRRDAPPGMNYDVYDSAVEYAEEAAITVNEGTMPLVGGIDPREKAEMYLWALCGTPQ